MLSLPLALCNKSNHFANEKSKKNLYTKEGKAHTHTFIPLSFYASFFFMGVDFYFLIFLFFISSSFFVCFFSISKQSSSSSLYVAGSINIYIYSMLYAFVCCSSFVWCRINDFLLYTFVCFTILFVMLSFVFNCF